MSRIVQSIAIVSMLVACSGANDGVSDSGVAPKPEGETAGDCADGADNDGDGSFDCDDDGCAGAPDCDSAAPACLDGAALGVIAGLEFVQVCAGSFVMGATRPQEDCGPSEAPRTVTLTHEYALTRTEVTQAAFRQVMGYSPSAFAGCDECPVETVSWHEAAAFTNRLSAQEGLSSCYACSGEGQAASCAPSGDPYACEGYRLLTEAEWERAAKCGEDTLYAGSDIVGDVAWYEENSGRTTQAVGTRDSNACGLSDMSGNVLEWAHDYGEDVPGASTDPSGPVTGTNRVLRGGAHSGGANAARVACRGWNAPGLRGDYLGFRVGRIVR